MKSLYICDLHNRIGFIKELIDLESPDEVIYGGDAMDAIGDDLDTLHEVALWLKRVLNTPGHYYILGNHDASYRWPNYHWNGNPAHTKERQAIFDAVLTKEDWQKSIFAVQRGNWWFSHGGLHPSLFASYDGLDPQKVWDKLHEAEFKCEVGLYTPIVSQATNRNGPIASGPLWLRWEEFTPIAGVNQVVGHTPHSLPQYKNTEDSQNVCLDTNNAHYAILEGGRLFVKENPFAPKADQQPLKVAG